MDRPLIPQGRVIFLKFVNVRILYEKIILGIRKVLKVFLSDFYTDVQ
jgi:hypothetical protein